MIAYYISERKNKNRGSKDGKAVLPDLKDHEAVQQFFLREVGFQ